MNLTAFDRPIVEAGLTVVGVGIALTIARIVDELHDGGYLRRARERYRAWRNRKPRPDTDYGLVDEATVTTFIGILHGEDEPSPLLHHTGEIPVTRLRVSGPVAAIPDVADLLDGEDTVPVLPTGVHGQRIGRRPAVLTLTRTESRTGEQAIVRLDEATPIFDALGPLPVFGLDVTFDWNRAEAEVRELVGVGA